MTTRAMEILDDVNGIYEALEGDELVWLYEQKHGIASAKILTVLTPADAIAALAPHRLRLNGKTIVEIGAGIGWLSLISARYCKEVFAIEADPAWSWVFARKLYAIKPHNLTWIFGNAESMIGKIQADIALVWTRSDTDGMVALGKQFAPEVILGPVGGRRI